MGVGIPAWHGGICRHWGVLPYGIEISAVVSKTGEILREKNIWRPLAAKRRT